MHDDVESLVQSLENSGQGDYIREVLLDYNMATPEYIAHELAELWPEVDEATLLQAVLRCAEWK